MLFVQAILHSFLEHRNVGKSKVFDLCCRYLHQKYKHRCISRSVCGYIAAYWLLLMDCTMHILPLP